MLLQRLVAVLALAACCTMQAMPQAKLQVSNGNGKLPPRPPIFLNNNASLYTFPNPNFGLPSQLPFAFVAVAHEDCRLFNNGAKLMPKHRLLAAECIQANMAMGGGGGGVVINPTTGQPIPGTGGPMQGGINYGRRPLNNPWLMAAYLSSYAANRGGYTPPANNGGYTSYPMQPDAVLTTAQGAPAPESSNEAAKPRSFKGFGFFREYTFGGFTTTLSVDPTRTFGRGFESESADSKKDRAEN